MKKAFYNTFLNCILIIVIFDLTLIIAIFVKNVFYLSKLY